MNFLFKTTYPPEVKRIAIILLIPFLSFSQNQRRLFFETGATIYTPFKQPETISYSDYQLNYSINSKYYSSLGFYTKLGIDMHPATNKKFYVTVPLFAAYKEFNTKVKTEGITYSGSSQGNWTLVTKNYSKSITISTGPKFNFELKKMSLYGAINLNVDVLYRNDYVTESSSNSGVNYSSKSGENTHGIMFSSSLQIGAEYHLTEKWGIGLSAESYFYNFNPLFDSSTENRQLFNMGYGKSSSLFCAGIRGSYKF